MVEFDVQIVLAAFKKHKSFPSSTNDWPVVRVASFEGVAAMDSDVVFSGVFVRWAFSSEQKASLVHHLVVLKVCDLQG